MDAYCKKAVLVRRAGFVAFFRLAALLSWQAQASSTALDGTAATGRDILFGYSICLFIRN